MMKKYFDVLRRCVLFDGIKDEDLTSLFGCLDAKVETYGKKDVIIAEGERAKNVAIVLSGTVQLERTDYEGNRSIVTVVEPSELFGESFACAELEHMPFDVIASEECEILLLDCKRIIHFCSNACDFHNRLILNLMKIISRKNIFLNQKAEITSKRTTREKLMAYLGMHAKKTGKRTFVIPYDRQALADYLEVDRSGLSAEISKLRKEGIIDCEKSTFKLL